MLFQETKAATDHTIVLHELLMAMVRIEPPDMRLVLHLPLLPIEDGGLEPPQRRHRAPSPPLRPRLV